jgi:hypothetical protein
MKPSGSGRRRALAASVALALIVTLGRQGPAAAELVAERITAERFATLRVGGPDADGGVGDWALQNGILCAVVSDPSHESVLSSRGGVLVDLGHCGRQDDQWSALQPMLNLTQSQVVPLEKVRAEVEPGEVRLVAEGAAPGVLLRTTYTLAEGASELRVITELERQPGGERIFAFADVAFHATGQLRPFSLLLRDLGRSTGFDHPSGDPSSPLSMVGSIVADDAHVLVGGDALDTPISYGLRIRGASVRRASGEEEGVASFAITGESYTLLGVFGEPFWFSGDLSSGGEPGLLDLAQLPFMDLDPGDTLVFERSLQLSQRSDVASLADAWLPGAVPVRGRVDDPEARLHFRELSGATVSQLRPQDSGAFRLQLPPGDYQVEARAPGGRSLERTIYVPAEGTELAPLEVGAPARLRLPRKRNLRLVFVPLDGTPDPRLGDDLLGLRVGGHPVPTGLEGNWISLGAGARDPKSVVLAPGRYRVLATKGLEYGIQEQELALAAGEEIALDIDEPPRALETPGWIAADLHVHSGQSFDSSFPLARQLVAFAAQGTEVFVATEHDRVFDPRPLLAELGLRDRMVGIVGVEATSSFTGGDAPHSSGHLNAFPVEYAADRYRGGAPAAEGRRLGSVLGELRRDPQRPLTQLNHPRPRARGEGGSLHYFEHLAVVGESFDPTRPLEAAPNRVLLETDASSGLRDLDYEAVELLNGPGMDRYLLTRADWFSLLRQGVVHTATANSDSHRAGEIAAMPRTYVALAPDRVAPFDKEGFLAALRAGRAYGTSGPILGIQLGDAGPGERFSGETGQLEIRVDAAPWVPVAEVRVLLDGAIVERRPIRAGEQLSLPLEFGADAFVTVEVEGPASETYAALAPGFVPFAFSNPIFVDADADGRWTPPGLQGPLPPSISDPLAPDNRSSLGSDNSGSLGSDDSGSLGS